MLRLRPSELTLTPEEVDDTFRRLAQRQALRASATVVSRAAHRHGRPVIRRGPQRSPRDAITVLGNACLLRLSPQHAIITSMDQDEDNAEFPTPETNPPVQPSQAASAYPAPSLGLRSMQLPLRLGPEHTHTLHHVTRDQGEQISILSNVDSPQHTPGTASSSPVRDSDLPFRPNTPTDGHAELRGGAGGEGSSRDGNRHGVQNAASTPSALRREHDLKSLSYTERSPDPVKASVRLDNDEPIRHLQGYFKSPFQEPLGISYHFTESILCPMSEPRPRTSRLPLPARSLSSGGIPAFSSHPPRPGAVETSHEKAFGTITGPSSTTQTARPSTGFRPRQSSSEMSGASAAFSYYGSLPSESRHSSSGQPASDNLARPQFDGATTRNEADVARHHRVRSLGRSSESPLPPPTTGSSRPSPASGQLGDLPLLPSSDDQMQRFRSTLQPPPGFEQPGPNSDFLDAMEAAARDLRSPLDDYSEQYQRLNRGQFEQEALSNQLRVPQPYFANNATSSRSISGGGTNRNNQVTRPTMPLEHDARGYSLPQPSLPPRSHQSARGNQRSSETFSASPPPTDHRSRGQVQTQRAAYELLQNASRAMQTMGLRGPGAAPPGVTMPPPSSPRDGLNRNRLRGSHQLAPRPPPHYQADTLMSSSPQHNPRFPRRSRAPAQAIGYGSPPVSSPPSFGPTTQFRDVPQRPQRTHRQVSTTTAPSLHLQPSRDSPLTSLALDHGSGVTSRRSRSPLARPPPIARTHRRVPAHQRDQENSAEVEISAMQREEAAVNARYGEVGQQDVMDETPPRVGRIERGMFE